MLGTLKPHTLPRPFPSVRPYSSRNFRPYGFGCGCPSLEGCSWHQFGPRPRGAGAFPFFELPATHLPAQARLAIPSRGQTRLEPLLSLPPAASSIPRTSSFPRGDDRGSILAVFQRQVVDFKAQIHAPSSDAGPCSSAAAPPAAGDRSDHHGRGFFRGNAWRYSCLSSFHRQNRGFTSCAACLFLWPKETTPILGAVGNLLGSPSQMDSGSPASSHHRTSRVSLDVGVSTST